MQCHPHTIRIPTERTAAHKRTQRKKQRRTENKEQDAHVRCDVSRRDAVDLDILCAPFVAERFGELAHRALGRSVRGDGEPALEGEQRGEVDDFAALEGDHVPPGRLREEPDRFEVHVDDLR